MSPESAIIEKGIEAICLEIVKGNEGQQGKRYEFGTGDIIKLGRETNCNLQILDKTVSKLHAVINKEFLGYVYLEDSGSRNGTYLNGVKIEGREIMRDGYIIKIGNTEIKYSHILRNQ